MKTHTHTHTHTCINIPADTDAHMQIDTHTHTHTHTDNQMHICKHTHTGIRKQAYGHIQTYLKYLTCEPLLFSIASREPMPRYFLSLTPSAKKYSPGASVVPANIEPIITVR